MNILHLYSDWKWTGPVEPVLHLCQELTHRGHHVVFGYRRPPQAAARSIAAYVGQFKVAATDQFRLNRYFAPWDNIRDLLAIRRFVREKGISVVHTHLDHDHALAAMALGLSRSQKTAAPSAGLTREARPFLVRSDHKRDSIAPSFAIRLLFRGTHGIVTFSERARQHLVSHSVFRRATVRKVNPAIDTARFTPEKGSRDLRKVWGLKDDDIAVGMVARFQRYRKSRLLLEALKLAIQRAPNLKAVLIGRGGEMEETVHQPVRALGLQKHVVTAGYLVENYLDGLASLDAFVFLIAGSDGTGRALREAMAMGKAVIVNQVGMLPEMVEPGRSGLLFNDTAEELADRLVQVAQDAALRRRLQTGAREHAKRHFSIAQQAVEMEAFYGMIAARAVPERPGARKNVGRGILSQETG